MVQSDTRGGRPLQKVATVPLPTSMGVFDAHAFERSDGRVYLALTRGEVDGAEDVVTRVHSECLTGDVLGSLRCDCGVQLRLALRAISAAGRGVLVYATGHEGRGIGLVDKLRAYVEQDRGADTVDANLAVGLAPDLRDYADAAAVLRNLGVRSVRLLTNNPGKVDALRRHGVAVDEVQPLSTAAHLRNRGYLATKQDRFGHVQPAGVEFDQLPTTSVDLGRLLGSPVPRPNRPYVVVKYAQTLDGRIATSTGDAKWISGEPERR